jgi:4-hydroxy-3-polyprenylbenzoate decarboxylase
MSTQKRIIIGVSGATGVVYTVELLKVLRQLNIETHLVITKAGEIIRAQETDLTSQQLRQLADYYHPIDNVAACISSGSFKTMGMIIAPCSMRSLGEIANSNTTNLLTRAAEVVLKERRRLVLLTREFPLHQAHLKNMLAVTEMGGIIAPPAPAFYTHPKTIDDLVAQTVGRTLDLFDLEAGNFPRWDGNIQSPQKASQSMRESPHNYSQEETTAEMLALHIK